MSQYSMYQGFVLIPIMLNYVTATQKKALTEYLQSHCEPLDIVNIEVMKM